MHRCKSLFWRYADMALSILIVTILVVVGAYMAYENRGLPEMKSRVILPVVLGIIGAFFTVLYSLKSEKVELQFNSTVYFHRSDLLVLDEHDKRSALYGGEQFGPSLRSYVAGCVERDERFHQSKSDKRGEEAGQLYCDMVLLKLIDRFFWAYADWWDVRITSQRLGDGVMSIVSPVRPDPDSASLAWERFVTESLDKDRFSSLLIGLPKQHWPEKMTVPPKTKGRVVVSPYDRRLVLTNPFVEVSITIRPKGGAIGVGDFAWLLGYDKKKSEEFWSELFDVSCNADFRKMRYGHPEMPRYRRWVETMFEEVQYQVGDTERIQRARDYRDLTRGV
ncbi:MAG: hypothetical protein A2Y76_00460 [Planctomycetes bacterium RBG_13_60_9]|nr:MAG: hypothetical protein A2Y76_00460 [Planctomycetes bacterium RBG_13_60_9]